MGISYDVIEADLTLDTVKLIELFRAPESDLAALLRDGFSPGQHFSDVDIFDVFNTRLNIEEWLEGDDRSGEVSAPSFDVSRSWRSQDSTFPAAAPALKGHVRFFLETGELFGYRFVDGKMLEEEAVWEVIS